jgi:hypothetical protein
VSGTASQPFPRLPSSCGPLCIKSSGSVVGVHSYRLSMSIFVLLCRTGRPRHRDS